MRKLFAAAFMALALSASITSTPILAGCAAIGVQKPETFNEKMVAGYKTVEAVADSATSLLVSGKISVEDAKNIHAQASVAKEGLDVTRTIHDSGDFSNSETRLTAVITALSTIQAYLISKGG